MSQTRTQLLELKLQGFIEVLDEIQSTTSNGRLDINDALAIMVERELCIRQKKRMLRLQKLAKLRYPNVYPEDIDYHRKRVLDESLLRDIMKGHWLVQHQNLILSGPTGVGKSFIACAIAQLACRSHQSVRYFRVPRLIEALAIARADGSYHKLLEQLSKVHLLILDDWGLDKLERHARKDILEVVEDRTGRKSTLLTTQLPVEQWHNFIGDPTIADAICDRLLHQAHILTIEGESGRQPASKIQSDLTHVDH